MIGHLRTPASSRSCGVAHLAARAFTNPLSGKGHTFTTAAERLFTGGRMGRWIGGVQKTRDRELALTECAADASTGHETDTIFLDGARILRMARNAD